LAQKVFSSFLAYLFPPRIVGVEAQVDYPQYLSVEMSLEIEEEQY
jgi:hypothetical protein